MSIINDALKKVQANITKNESKEDSEKPKKKQHLNEPQQIPAAPSSAGPSKPRDSFLSSVTSAVSSKSQQQHIASSKSFAETKPRTINSSKSHYKTLAAFLIIICAAFGIIMITYLLKRAPKVMIKKPPIELRAEKPTEPVEPIKLVTEPASTPKMHISGIMTMENRNVVLINNEIYEEGDTINGIKIISISLDSIKVLEGKKTRTIEVKQ